MVRHGEAPFLECSSKGDARFSAFSARVRRRNNRSVEDLYQAAKVLADGSTGLGWRAAKGRAPVNLAHVRRLYDRLWFEYVDENPELAEVLLAASGLSDVYGQPGHACQATSLWKVRESLLNRRRLLGAGN